MPSHCLKQFTPGITIILLLIAIANHSFAQDTAIDSKNIDNKYYITLSPVALIDVLDHPSLRISGDAKIYKNITLSVENIFYMRLGDWFYKKDAHGFSIKPCVKYWLNKDKINGGYIGLEYQYKQLYYNLSDSIKISGVGQYFKEYGMTRYVNCINIKYGELTTISGRFISEFFIGVGIRFLHSFSELSKEEHDNIIYGDDHHNIEMDQGAARTIGNHIYPNITLGYKIGYRF